MSVVCPLKNEISFEITILSKFNNDNHICNGILKGISLLKRDRKNTIAIYSIT
jgi:hypothetical protein